MRKKMNLILIIIWMILIFVMSSFDGNESAVQSNIIVNFIMRIFNIDNAMMISLIIRKLAHFTEYLVLGMLLYGYCSKWHISVFISLLYATSDEIHQLFVPGRACQIRDILIDTCGAILGVLLLFLLKKILDKKN